MGTWNITSRRMSYDEMRQLLDMMGISRELLVEAEREGVAHRTHITVRLTPLEGLYTLTFTG